MQDTTLQLLLLEANMHTFLPAQDQNRVLEVAALGQQSLLAQTDQAPC